MSQFCLNMLTAGVFFVFLVGCANKDSTDTTDASPPDPKYLATSEPDGAVGVGEARASLKDQEQVDVVLVGRIGGIKKPFVEGAAVFTIVDPKVPHCAPEENCPTPWDYCCTQNEVKGNKATIKIVDKDGNPVARNADKLLGVKALDLVVVQGKAKKDEAGNFTVLASQVFVKK